MLYNVYGTVDGGPEQLLDQVCLTNPPDAAPPTVTPGLVAAEFRRIAWPASPLIVQPPGGRTLVNLPTNFYTSNTAPQAQTVTLLGQQVDIEAAPASWLWDHGDGTTQTTTTPGAAYPALTVTHTYTTAADQLALRVDTTYTGRYRVDGGPWQTIPATATIPGEPATLAVLTATPQLIAAE